MGRVSKITRFMEMREFPHVFEPDGKEILTRDYYMKGKWNRDFFRNGNPVVLELGCGKGEYTVDLARRFPVRNFIGVDIKGSRMWKGARESISDGLGNVAFLRTRIEFIERMFGPGEVEEIWITFPDPQLKKPRKRLTSSVFLSRYQKLLIPGGKIHLKTDSEILHQYTIEMLAANSIKPLTTTADLYGSLIDSDILAIRTYYESKFLEVGKKITYLTFELPAGLKLTEPNQNPRP